MSTFQLFLQQLAVICKKEILSIWQDPATRRIVVIPCILMGFLFGYAANYNLEKRRMSSLTRAGAGLRQTFFPALTGHRFSTAWRPCRMPMKSRRT